MDPDCGGAVVNIELITTESLLTELAARFDHYVFSGIKSKDTASEVEVRRHAGGWRTCQGMAMGLILDLEKSRSADIEPMDMDDV